jgi:hypothetical protein
MGHTPPQRDEMEHHVRGVIDRYEGDVAVIVLDDDQEIRWPLSRLPAGCQPGMAVQLQLVTRSSSGVEQAAVYARLPVRVRQLGQQAEWEVRLEDDIIVKWPSPDLAMMSATEPLALELVPDVEDTVARRRRVRGLVDDIFGSAPQ